MQDHLVVHPRGELHPLRRRAGCRSDSHASPPRPLRGDAARMSACCSAVKPFCSGGTDGAGAKPAVARRNVAATSARPVCRAAIAWPRASRSPLMNSATAIAVAARTSDPPAMSATVTGWPSSSTNELAYPRTRERAAVYAGVPVANRAFAIAQDVLGDEVI